MSLHTWILRFTSVLPACFALLVPFCVPAQEYSLTQQRDSVWLLSLGSSDAHDNWRLPYPVYRFCTGDVNNDGCVDALVGVVKGSRHFPQPSRRVFVFKDVSGSVRPLWLGSRLGGELVDFAFVDGAIRAIELKSERQYVVSDYRWRGFGPVFDKVVAESNNLDYCYKLLQIPNPN